MAATVIRVAAAPGSMPPSVWRKVRSGASAVNRWTWRNVNPFDSESKLTRWVGDHARDLGSLIGCAISFKRV
jgi:hypothetical protein